MGGTVCLKSWYKSCEAIALAAIFALNSTPIWAANQIISSEETFYEAEGTSSNSLKIYGTSIDASINGGYSHYIYDGGKAIGTKISKGDLYVNSGGVAANSIVNGGEITIYSDAIATSSTMNKGSITVKSGGIVEDTTVNDGEMIIYSGGKATDTKVNGGSFSIKSDGTAINTTVYDGKIKASSGSRIDGLTIVDKGSFEFSTDTTLVNAIIYDQKTSIVDKTSDGLVLNTNNLLKVDSGGTAINAIIDGGDLIVYSDGTAINSTITAGNINVKSGGLLTNTLINGGLVEVESRGKVNNTTVTKGDLKIKSGAEVADTTINGGSISVESDATITKTFLTAGSMNIKSGATATNTNISGGKLFISFDSTATDTTMSGGVLSVFGNATNISIIDGKIEGGAGSTLSGLSISENGAFDFSTDVTLINTKIFDKQVSIMDKTAKDFVLNNGSVLNVITGSKSINTTINDGLMSIFGSAINTVVNGGKIAGNSEAIIDGLTINNSGSFEFNTSTIVNNATQNGKDISIIGGVAKGLTVNENSKLSIFGNNSAIDIVVEKGGNLITKAESIIDGLVAKAESILNVDKDTLLKGDIVVDKLANVSGSSYDFNSLFQNENASSLTVTGGVNEVFVKDEASRLVNEDTTSDKSLTLADGEYSIASVIKEGSTQVAGWDVINIKASESAPSTIVKLESDIELVGSNKEVNIGENAVLDVSGHSPLEITIDGSVTNQGTMDFTIYDNDGEADDVVTIAGDYRASPGALIVLNIEPEKDKADKLVIQGDVIGNTNVFLKSNSETATEAEILFAEVANDNEATASKFDIWRVEGSPFEWDTKKEEGKWYTYIDDGSSETQPGGSTETSGVRKLASEMIAYMGLYEAGFEQTSGLSRVVSDQVAKNQLIGRGCRNRVCREIEPVLSSWVSPVHQNVDVKAPYKYEAKINGLDAGIDIGSDGINKWGVLASYRKGDYDFDGEGEKYYSEKGSEIDIDSYGMGLYFRRDKYNTKFAGMVYAGLQKAEISSDDGVKANTDALEIGASLDVSHIYEVVKDLTIAPELQISYQMLDYDNIKDNAGKKVQLEASHRFTIEAGAKVEKKWKLDEGKASIYVKPSIVQTVHGGGKLNVAGLEGIHTSENRTLGRFEIGGEYEVNTRWSVGATAAHTFGADYKDTTFSLDAKYRF